MTMFCFFDINESKVYWSRPGQALNIQNLLIEKFLCLNFVDSVFCLFPLHTDNFCALILLTRFFVMCEEKYC
jgi:hypothetical protein